MNAGRPSYLRLRELEDRCQELGRLNDRLSRRLAELEDHDLRHAYRRGYLTGYMAARRGAVAAREPERHARGELGRVLRVS